MKTKLIAIDVDGTLLDESGLLKEFTKDYLSLLSKQGIMIVLASGRPPRSLMGLYNDLCCFGPYIAYNGALVKSPKRGAFPKIEHRFKRSVIKQLYIEFERDVATFTCESLSKYYYKRKDKYLEQFFPSEGMKEIEGPMYWTLYEDPFTCLFKCGEDIKVFLKRRAEEFENVKWRSWTDSAYSELYLEGVNKGSGLKAIMDFYHINKDEVIAFGDSDNDLEMLQEAGTAYAIKGCKSDLLKSNFPETIETVENEGLALTLKKILD